MPTPTLQDWERNPNSFFPYTGGMLGTPAQSAYGARPMPQIPYQPFAYGQTGYTGLSPVTGINNDYGGLMGAGGSNPYDIVNAMSSGNMRAMYAPRYDYMGTLDTNRSNERMQSQALQSKQDILGGLLPHVISALGSFGGGQAGFQTNYGASGQMGSQAQPTNVQAMRRNPVLEALARMGIGV